MVIWKYQLDDEARQVVMMPSGAQIMSVQQQHGDLQLWALVDPDLPKQMRVSEIFSTGTTMPDLSSEGRVRRHVATVQVCQGMLVWHVFELQGL